MNPLEFPWTEDQQVTVSNPTNEPYTFKVHSKEYQVGPGKSATMPGYIAWVYVYGMAVKLVQADGFFNRWNEEGFRKEYYDQIVTGADPVLQNIEVEEKPLVEQLDAPDEPSIEEGDELDNEPAPSTKVQPMKSKAVGDKSPSRA